MGICGEPKKCCHLWYTPPTFSDECRCGCGMLNGVFQILCGQFLLFVGFWFSVGTIADCDFVTLEEPGIKVREDGTMATQIGLFSYKQKDVEDGSGLIGNTLTSQCYYWYDEEIRSVEPFSTGKLYWNDQIKYYVNIVLGPDWLPVLVLTCTACVLSFFGYLYAISFCCSTQIRGVRWFTGLFICIAIAMLQIFGTWLIYYSDWCENRGGCTMGRSTIFSIVASCCFFLSGIFFLYSNDYPGTQLLDEMKNKEQQQQAADLPTPKATNSGNSLDNSGANKNDINNNDDVEKQNNNNNNNNNSQQIKRNNEPAFDDFLDDTDDDDDNTI